MWKIDSTTHRAAANSCSIKFVIAFCVMLDRAVSGVILAVCMQQMVLLHWLVFISLATRNTSNYQSTAQFQFIFMCFEITTLKYDHK